MNNNILVSLLLVCRNEESFIVETLHSLYDEIDLIGKERGEIIIVDGMSTDNTEGIVKNEIQKHPDISMSYLTNKKRTLATGWNLAIQHAKGKYVVRPDAHGGLVQGYVKKGISILETHPEVAAVGGVLETKADGFWGEIIMEALSSPVAVGNSAFRTGVKMEYTDTAVFAVYRKEVFDSVGLFNEKLIRHQDNDFHYRLRNAGWKLMTTDEMKAVYYCRNTPELLFRQMFDIGLYLPDLLKVKSYSGIRVRHFVPFAFVVYVVLAVILSVFNPSFRRYLFPLGVYFLIIFSFVVFKSINKMIAKHLHLSWIIPGMHFSYGTGTIVGLSRYLVYKLNNSKFE